MEGSNGKKWLGSLFGRKREQSPQVDDTSTFKLLRTFDAESDDGKRRIHETIRNLKSIDTLGRIALDRSLQISLRELAIKCGHFGGDEWATFLSKNFVIGKNYGDLSAKATPGGDAESGEALTLLFASAFALNKLGYEIEGTAVLSPTKLSMKKGVTISVVKKAGQQPVYEQQESPTIPNRDLFEQAKRLEELINTFGSCQRGYFAKRLPINLGQLSLELLTICGQRGSHVGIDMCRRIVKQNPNSGLAHYLLFNALAAGKPDGNILNPNAANEADSGQIEGTDELALESMAAFQEAMRLGCKYVGFNVQAGMMELHPLDRVFD